MTDTALSSRPQAVEPAAALLIKLLPLNLAVFLVYLTIGAPLGV